MTPFAPTESDEEKVKSWRLEVIPPALAKELDGFVLYRSSPINRQRDGTCVVEVSASNRTAVPTLVHTFCNPQCVDR
jgi:hypothetical protein